MIHNNILSTIGNSPMVQINNLGINPNIKVYAKIEGVNPGGSIKDRIALKMLEQAEKQGDLTKEQTIIEATSGNTGIALAMIGAIKGYKVKIVMSEAVSQERRTMIQAFGADISLTNSEQGTDGAIKQVRDIVADNQKKYFTPDQFSNKYNQLAHYETTAHEIWKQTNGQIDYFVSSIGTSGTLMGVGSYLKKMNPAIKIISAEPVRGHYIQGLKNMAEAIIPSIYNPEILDRVIKVDSENAFQTARQIISREGIFVGMSSGAAMWAVNQLAQSIDSGSIVTIFPDRGEKYLSTGLFN